LPSIFRIGTLPAGLRCRNSVEGSQYFSSTSSTSIFFSASDQPDLAAEGGEREVVKAGHEISFRPIPARLDAERRVKVQFVKHASRPSARIVAAPSRIDGRAFAYEGAGLARRPILRRGQDGGQTRGLFGGEVARLDAEMMARGGLGAEDAFVELRHVEVDLENAPLGPERLHQGGDRGFQRLAQPGPAMPQEGVLHRLLADRGTAARGAGVDRGADRGHVEAPVQAEIRVLGGNDARCRWIEMSSIGTQSRSTPPRRRRSDRM
jgi:hypothetical protein